MKVRIENMGLLTAAEFDVGDLTIICGENNTGKTYATYALYGFLKSYRSLLHPFVGKSGGPIDLVSTYQGKVNTVLAQVCQSYVKTLPSVFSTTRDRFEHTTFQLTVDHEPDILASEYHKAFRVAFNPPPRGTTISLTKQAGQPWLVWTLPAPETGRILQFPPPQDLTSEGIAEIVFAPVLPNVFIASAERTGAAIFRKELDFAKSRVLEALAEPNNDLRSNPARFLRTMEVGYAWPVRDNVDFVRQLDDLDRETGPLMTAYPELSTRLSDVIGGSYRVIKGKGLVYVPKTHTKATLTMTESSSSVRSLLDVVFYLKARARVGDLLMIDEPELNLHPVNQRRLARLLAYLVHLGIKVFITTHSDYIIKELNTLIMLHRKTDHTQAVQHKFGYRDDELLDPAKVRVYLTDSTHGSTGKRKKKQTSSVMVSARIDSELGIVAETFDQSIDEMNTIQDEILYG